MHAYEELREIDLVRDGEPVDQPLFLVCTHGKHDRCCARYGRPVFDALAEQLDDEWVWQTTHVGGDRFAGNVVCLPHGLYYGRVEREDALTLVDEQLAGRVFLDRYRGRSCWPFAAQAAERSIRDETGLVGVDELRLASLHRDGAQFRVGFVDGAGRRHERDVVGGLGAEDYLTCTSPRPERPRRYVVRG